MPPGRTRAFRDRSASRAGQRSLWPESTTTHRTTPPRDRRRRLPQSPQPAPAAAAECRSSRPSGPSRGCSPPIGDGQSFSWLHFAPGYRILQFLAGLGIEFPSVIAASIIRFERAVLRIPFEDGPVRKLPASPPTLPWSLWPDVLGLWKTRQQLGRWYVSGNTSQCA